MANENLAVLITGKGGELVNEFRKIGDEAEKAGKKTASGWDKAKTGIKVAGAAIAGTALAVGAASVEMADKYEVSHARLETALKNSGTSWEKQKKQIDAVSDAATKFGYTKTDVEGALAQMTTGMGSSAKAMKNFQLVEDITAKTGKPLADVALAVTKASQGQLRPLKMLGIDLPVAAGGALKLQKAQDALAKAQTKGKQVAAAIHAGLLKGPAAAAAYSKANADIAAAQDKLNTTQNTGTTILDALTQKMGGAASAQAETFGGKVKALKAQIDNVAITIGMALMPILIKMADFIQQKVIPFFQQHTGYAKVLAIALGVTLVAAASLYIASMVAAAAATVAATWPILAVVAAVALVGVGLTKLGVNWGNVWRGMQKVYDGLHLQGAVDGVKTAIDGIGTAAETLSQNWGGIWRGIENDAVDALNQIIRVWNDTIGAITGKKIAAIGAVQAPTATRKSPMGPFVPTPMGPFRRAQIPGVNGEGPVLPGGPPHRAAGGSVLPWHTYKVNETGHDEYLTMGSKGGYITPASRAASMAGGPLVVNLYVTQPLGTPDQVARAVVPALQKWEQSRSKSVSARPR